MPYYLSDETEVTPEILNSFLTSGNVIISNDGWLVEDMDDLRRTQPADVGTPIPSGGRVALVWPNERASMNDDGKRASDEIVWRLN